jgi:hypothetical protein
VGRYTTTLRINSERLSPVRQVYWVTESRAEIAQQEVELLSPGGEGTKLDWKSTPTSEADISRIVVEGKASGTSSPFRIACNHRSYERFVILAIEYEDGVTLEWHVELRKLLLGKGIGDSGCPGEDGPG